MKKIPFIALVSLIFIYGAVSVAFASDYGESFQTKYAEYNKEKYPDDPYIWLKDEAEVVLREDGSYTAKKMDIYKILKDEARYLLGEQQIEFNAAYEEIESIKAVTISPKGTIEQATQIQELSPYSGFPLYSSNRIKIVSLPGVVEGSIIVVKRVIKGRKVFKGEYWDAWFFQSIVPVATCSYKITAPASKKLYISKKNTDIEPLVEASSDGKYITYYWQKKNIEKIEPEEMAPYLGEILPQLALSTVDDWEKLAQALWNLYVDKIGPDNAIEEKAKEVAEGKKTDAEKVASILRYIQNNFRYVSLSFGSNAIEPHYASETFKNKYGDCKDQCALLAAMLKAVDIESTPVLVHYPTFSQVHEKSPSPDYFTHIVLKIDLRDRSIFVDPLVSRCSPEDMHLSLDTSTLFIFNGHEAYFEKKKASDISNYTNTKEVNIILEPSGSAKGRIKIILEKADHPQYRLLFNQLTNKQKELFCKTFISLVAPKGEVTSFTYADPENYKEPFFVDIKFEAPDFIVVTGDYIILELSEFTASPLFAKDTRRNPIVTYLPRRYITHIEYHIPEGYEIEYLPESFSYETPLDIFSSAYEVVGNKILVKHEAELKIVHLPPSTYKEIRETYNKLTSEGKKRLILKKRK